jgi:hypothetical protein
VEIIDDRLYGLLASVLGYIESMKKKLRKNTAGEGRHRAHIEEVCEDIFKNKITHEVDPLKTKSIRESDINETIYIPNDIISKLLNHQAQLLPEKKVQNLEDFKLRW